MAASDSVPIAFNPLQPGYVEDPYSHHSEVRESAPVQAVLDRWGLFAYQDCFELLRDGTMSVDDQKSTVYEVISEMLGMPAADRDTIKTWSGHMVKMLDPIVSDEELRLAVESGVAMDRHINQVIEAKRQNPGDDLLTGMIDARDDDDRLSTPELVSQITLLFIAGHETTVNLIGTGFYELMRNPDQMEVWRDDPDVAPAAVEELLRYVSPVQMSRRIALRDIEFNGVEIPSGGFVMAVLASANRDRVKFGPDADQLDLRRANASQHLAFGSGAHYCLGASLAKLEAQVGLGALVDRFSHATLASEPAWNGRINLRGLEVLPVAV